MDPPQKTRETAASGPWRWGVPLVALAMLLRLGWVLAVPTVPVGDFATYRESANYLVEFGALDHGFIYMPGFVLLLAGVLRLGGELLAQKLLGVLFGTLAAAAIFGVTTHLADEDENEGEGEGEGQDKGESPRDAMPGAPARPTPACPCPTAVIATLFYALWPAGVALSSVVGTDVPAAALIMLALWALTAWGHRRPRGAALGFGALMGLAAYVRAVALPLTLMSAAYWWARRGRKGWREIAQLTALTTAATLTMLLPWALRNWREHGALSFTDDHGGITALIGANPNSEGTYTRALNVMFKDLTGRGVLDEPHRETDRLAFDLAKDWSRFEPWYALGLVTLKAERLYWSEWHLLYWPIGRPGVLVGGPQRWFAARATTLYRVADGFWFGLCGLFAAGVALAIADRRWRLLTLLPFQLALTLTYATFFAEPRYRLPIEMMAFPLAAFALRRLWVVARGLGADRSLPAIASAAGRLALAGAAATALFLIAPATVDAGQRLRVAHRWAATVWTVDRQPRLAKWRRYGRVVGPSPVAGAPNGARLTLVGDAPAEAEIVTAPLPAGRYHLTGEIEASSATPRSAPGAAVQLALDGVSGRIASQSAAIVADGRSPERAPLDGTFVHTGGPLHLIARLTAASVGGEPLVNPSVWISSIDLRSAPVVDEGVLP